jgi:hypothetical protein
VFAEHLGQSSDELTERKLAELYEKLGRVIVERRNKIFGLEAG